MNYVETPPSMAWRVWVVQLCQLGQWVLDFLAQITKHLINLDT